MKKYLLSSFKRLLTLLGKNISAQKLQELQIIIHYMKLGRWMVDHKFVIPDRKADRTAVFDAVSSTICTMRVLYLEFGVYKGTSMRYWSDALKHEVILKSVEFGMSGSPVEYSTGNEPKRRHS